MNPVSDAQVEEFGRYVKKWQDVLGLQAWRIERGSRRPKKVMAEVTFNDEGMLATYRVGTNFGSSPVTPEALESCALHEVLHITKLWGDTTHRHWWVGHVHHKDVKEYPGVTVEYCRTLAARDSWHQGQGYRAGRDMQLVVYHRTKGEIERHRCDVGMIEEVLDLKLAA